MNPIAVAVPQATETQTCAPSGAFRSFHNFIAAAEAKVQELWEKRDLIARGVLKVDDEARAALAIVAKFTGASPYLVRMLAAINTVLDLGDKAAADMLSRDRQS